MEKYRSFEELPTSTRTIMVYSNAIFDRKAILCSLPLHEIIVPLTKKKRNVDRRRLKAEKGKFLSVQMGDIMRGPDLRKKKKYFCPICKPYKIRGDKKEQLKTVTPELKPASKDILKHYKIEWDTSKAFSEIGYICTKCLKEVSRSRLNTILHFQNEVTFTLSLGHTIVNVMVFKSSFKIVNCKTDEDALETVDILMKTLNKAEIKPWVVSNTKFHENISFIFKRVMRNVDFKIGFPIDREQLTTFMNSPQFKDKISIAIYEPSSNANVNIKFYCSKPSGTTYKCVTYNPFKAITEVYSNHYKTQKKNKQKLTILIVFSSSEVILTGRYDTCSKEVYEFFMDTVLKNRQLLEEKTTF